MQASNHLIGFGNAKSMSKKYSLVLSFDDSLEDESIFNHEGDSLVLPTYSEDSRLGGYNDKSGLFTYDAYLDFPHHSTFNLGSNDFIIEMSVKLYGWPQNCGGFYAFNLAGHNTIDHGYGIMLTSTTFGISVYKPAPVSDEHFRLTHDTPIALNVWYDAFVSRESGILKIGFNGQTEEIDVGVNFVIDDVNTVFRIGKSWDVTYSYKYYGLIDNFKLYNGGN